MVQQALRSRDGKRPFSMGSGLIRRLLMVVLDLFLLSGAYLLAYLLRYGIDETVAEIEVIGYSLLLVLPVSIAVHIHFGLFNAILRYASIETAVAVAKAVLTSVLLSFVALFLAFRLEGVPRSVLAIYGMAALIFVGGSRVIVRVASHLGSTQSEGKKVLIYGTGDDAELVIRALRGKVASPIVVAGIIDDKGRNIGRELLGIKVIGGHDVIANCVAQAGIEELWICKKEASGDELRPLFREANNANVIPLIVSAGIGSDALPKLQASSIDVSDLLRRPARMLDQRSMSDWIRGQRVLVTGGGGSIGIELARQVGAIRPDKLMICDVGEENLFNADRELREKVGSILEPPMLLNVCDRPRFEKLIGAFKPTIVFHAAAFKHVPLVELNPCEGIINNVNGLLVAAEVSQKAGVRDFVFISTDKAVRPTSVMGASKRLGELVVRSLALNGPTKFMAVRFGNVLGSSGSVVPLFQEQIMRGGPVTVTDPRMKRYFMLVSEAARLVIQAGAIGATGDVFLLNMGEPVSILELAESMIRLMGKKPGADIEIRITGARPGEKLEEELLVSSVDKRTTVDDIFIDSQAPCTVPWPELRSRITELVESAAKGEVRETLLKLRALVPDYQPRAGDGRMGLPSVQHPSALSN